MERIGRATTARRPVGRGIVRLTTVLAVAAASSATAVLGFAGVAGATGSWQWWEDADVSTAIASVSCASTWSCAAVDANGEVLTWLDGGWSAPSSTGDTGISAVSCPEVAFCVAVGGNGTVETWDGSSWSWGSIAAGADLTSVSCATATFCAALDHAGDAFTYNGTTWKEFPGTDSAGAPSSVSCATAVSCVAVDGAGDVLAFNGSTWSAASNVDTSGALTSVSCATAASCVAVDGAGDAFVDSAGAWTEAAGVDGTTALASVSCPSVSFCVAVDAAGAELTYSGGTWSAAPGTDQYGHFTAVSCVSTLFCEAGDSAGNFFVYSDSGPTAGPVSASLSTVAASSPVALGNGSTLVYIAVTLVDAAGNPEPGRSVTLAASGEGGASADVNGIGSATTDGNGVALFLVAGYQPQYVVFGATDSTDSVPVDDTAVVDFTAPAVAAKSTIAASPTSVSADGVATSTVTVTMKDAAGSPMPSKEVQLTASVSGGTYDGSGLGAELTNASGQAKFVVTDTTPQKAAFGATDLTDDVSLVATSSVPLPTVTFTPAVGSSAKSTVLASPTVLPAGGGATSTVTATVRDASGDPLAGRSVGILRSPAVWSPQATFDAGGEPMSVSCPSASFCAAVDFSGNAFTYDGVSWSGADSIDPGYNLTSVSCPSTTLCVAVDDLGHMFVYDGSSWSKYQWITYDDLTAVSCPPSAPGTVFCMAVTANGASFTYNGASWSGGPAVTGADTPIALSCPTTTFCVAFDEAGNALKYNGTSWTPWSSNPVDPTSGASVDSVSCPTTTFCMAVDDFGDAIAYNGSTWTPSDADGSTAISGVSCPNAASCTAMDANGNALTYNGKTWAATAVATGATMYSSSCPTTTFCAVLGRSGVALQYGGYVDLPAATGAAGTVSFAVSGTVAGKVSYTAVDATDGVTLPAASVTYSPDVASATSSTIAASAAKVPADGSTAATVTVTVRNSSGVVLPGKTVSLAGSVTGGTFGGSITPSTAQTNASGVATFAVTDTSVESDILSASDTTDSVNLSKTVTVAFEPDAASATLSTVKATSGVGLADGSTPSAIAVTLKDSAGVALPGKTVSLAGSVTGGTFGGSVTPSTAETNASGVASFAVTDPTPGSATFGAQSVDDDDLALTGTATVVFGATTPTAASMKIAASSAGVPADGMTASVVTVTVLDASGHPLPGKAISLTGTPTGTGAGTPFAGTVTPSSAETSASGVATFSVTDGSAQAVSFTAEDTTDGVTGSAAAPVTFAAATASATLSTVTVTPATLVANGTACVTVTVTLKNASKELLAGKVVSLVGTPAGAGAGSAFGGLLPVPTTTGAKGVATFCVADATAQTVEFQATDTTDGVTVTAMGKVTYTAPVEPK